MMKMHSEFEQECLKLCTPMVVGSTGSR